MGVLIVLGTVGLAVAIVQRFGSAGDAAAVGQWNLGQPAGTRIVSVAGTDGRFAVTVVRPDGAERILLVDPRRARVVGELRAAE
jgi:hypothetical protein